MKLGDNTIKMQVMRLDIDLFEHETRDTHYL